jgi:hypothetical protein
MKVLVIPEDVRKDQYMLKPIVQAMMKQLGQAKATVEVCQNPRLQGVSQVLNWERIEKILNQYKWEVDLFLICVDRDGEPNREQKLRNLELQSNAALGNQAKLLIAENAWQEMEVWVLAGFSDLPTKWNWKAIRDDRDPKEAYFYPFAEIRGVLNSPAQGRSPLAQEAARKYDRIRQLCPELQDLEGRIQAWLTRST